ncbi:hypothetical protein ACHAPT_003053 [Fusarium lateritium]
MLTTIDWPSVESSSTFTVASSAKIIHAQGILNQSVRECLGKRSKPGAKSIKVGRTRGIEEASKSPTLPQSAGTPVTFYANFILLKFQRQGQHKQFEYSGPILPGSPPPVTSSPSRLTHYPANETEAFSASGPGSGSAYRLCLSFAPQGPTPGNF